MRRNLLYLSVTIAFLLLAACAAEPEPEPEISSSAPAEAPLSADALSGTWSGDWGPSERDRNPVTMTLQWDGSNLTGTINPEQNPAPLTSASYNPETGEIMLEADVQARGAMVHYVMEGRVEGNTMTGTWMHDDRSGDFRVTKS